MDDLYSKFTELYGRRNSLSNSDREFIKTTYLNRFNGRMSKTCNQAYTDAITHILVLLRVQNKEFTTMKKSNYQLKNGAVINSPEYGIVGNSNITDEIAEKYLKKFPNQIVRFAVYPADWHLAPSLSKGEVEENSGSETLTVETISVKISALEAEIETLQNKRDELLKAEQSATESPKVDESKEQGQLDQEQPSVPEPSKDYDESQLIDAIRQLKKGGHSNVYIIGQFINATIAGEKITQAELLKLIKETQK